MMQAQLLNRIDTQLLYPALLDRILQMLEACTTQGFDYWATSGFRSAQEQDELYAQGRTKPGSVVTNAKGFQSAHNFGLAVDFTRDLDRQRAGLQPGWAAADYEELGARAAESGLIWGGTFAMKDRPHVQLPGYVTSVQLAPLKEVYLAAPVQGLAPAAQALARLQAVWAYLDENAAATL